jgi:4-hydroxymandelate oxidase
MIVSLAEAADRAARTLPVPAWDHIEGGSGAETALAANRAAFDAVRFAPRVLRGIADAHPSADLHGPVRMPVAVAPMAYQSMVHDDGELAVARAAGAARIPMVVPLLSSVPIEALAETGAPLWFQLYWLRDRGRTTELVQRAEAAGCGALMLTVDMPRRGRRLRDLRHMPAVPAAPHLPEAVDLAAVAELFDPAVSWADLAWLRAQTKLPLWVKGILHPEDAKWAAAEGAHGIVVSNHGGRQFDAVVPAIQALPSIREAVTVPLLLDSGVRGGLDVLRALALGAHGVLLGRPVLWGLAAGEEGVTEVLDVLHAELVDAMLQAGVADIAEARTITRLAR